MDTRIREYRKRHGLTLQALAQKVGTTAQTVQRLETAHMTVSMDWLKKFADAFNVRINDLIADAGQPGIALLGRMRRSAMLPAAQDGAAGGERIALTIPAEEPVAVQLDEDIGPYPRGTIVIGNKLRGADMASAHGRDCIVASEDGQVRLRRVLMREGRATLVPLDPSEDVRFDAAIVWAARVVMTARYM